MAQKKNVNEMSFLDHLEELRWHLIRATMGVLIIGTVAFLMKDFVFETVLFGPKKPDFPTYKMFCNLSQLLDFGMAFLASNPSLQFRGRKWQGHFLHIFGHQFGQGLL